MIQIFICNFAVINIKNMRNLILICLMILAVSCGNSKTNKEKQMNSDNKNLTELLQDRRSIRRYTDRKIPRDTLMRIAEVGLFAPSSYGQNPVEFVVIDDPAMLHAVAECKSIGAPSVANAAAAIIVAVDTVKGELWVEDASVAAGYILLGAENLGVGACWNQIHLRDGQKISASKEICQITDIPSSYEVVAVIALGYPAEHKSPRTLEEMKPERIHFDKF